MNPKTLRFPNEPLEDIVVYTIASTMNNRHDKRRRQAAIVAVKLPHVASQALIDTGSAVCLIRAALLPESLEHALRPAEIPLVSAGGQPLPVVGVVDVPILLDNNKYLVTFYVARELVHPIILGIDFMTDHGLIIDCTTALVRGSICYILALEADYMGHEMVCRFSFLILL